MTKSTITREQLLEIIETDHVQCGEASYLARIALAAMDSEPVAYMYDGEDGTEYNGHNEFSGGGKGIPLYRHAQPAPVVPDEIDWSYFPGEYHQEFADGWNACRAAMLAAATQSPGSEPATVPGKWIPVSERMPDEGDHVLVSDGVGMEVSWNRGREWKKLRHIYSEDVTHWMPLPSAPQEENP